MATHPPSSSSAPPPPDEDRRLTRRALLLGGGLLVPSVILFGALAHRSLRPSAGPHPAHGALPTEVSQRLHRAAEAAAAGRLPLARQKASAVLTSTSGKAQALFILACVALEAGDTREAETTLARLATTAPELAELRLLERLLARRRTAPSSDWCESFRETWTELGRPDFERTHLLTRLEPPSLPTTGDEDAHAWRATPSLPARLALALTSPPLPREWAEWLLQQVPTLEDPALFVATAGLLSGSTVSTAFQQRAGPVLHHKLDALARASPRAMQLQLYQQLRDTSEDEAFTARELEALEAVAALPSWREGTGERTVLEARRQLKEAGVPHASRRSFALATAAALGPAHALLRERTEATRSQLRPGSRHVLGRILMGVGTRMADESLLVPRTLGLLMCRSAAEDLQDSESRARFDEASDELFAVHAEFRKAALALWPIASLLEDAYAAAARDECAFLRAFASPEALHRAMADRPDPLQCVPLPREPLSPAGPRGP